VDCHVIGAKEGHVRQLLRGSQRLDRSSKKLNLLRLDPCLHSSLLCLVLDLVLLIALGPASAVTRAKPKPGGDRPDKDDDHDNGCNHSTNP